MAIRIETAVLAALVIAALPGTPRANDDVLVPGTSVALERIAEQVTLELEVESVAELTPEEVAELAECTGGRRVGLRSTRPAHDDANGAVFLRAALTSLGFDGAEAADRAFDDVLGHRRSGNEQQCAQGYDSTHGDPTPRDSTTPAYRRNPGWPTENAKGVGPGTCAQMQARCCWYGHAAPSSPQAVAVSVAPVPKRS